MKPRWMDDELSHKPGFSPGARRALMKVLMLAGAGLALAFVWWQW